MNATAKVFPSSFQKSKPMIILLVILLVLFIHINNTEAYAAITNANILNSVMDKYKTAAKSWGSIIQERATWLFFVLATISMVWTFSQLMFHRSSLAEFFGETIRFMMFTGFFLWLLRNGPKMADSIIASLVKIGLSASKQGEVLPSSIVDIGFDIFKRSCDGFSSLSPVIGCCGIILSAVVLVILALIAVNMLLQLCSAWVLAYAGIFFLGFGGSRWTSDMAINYFKTVLGVGASLMTMVLLVGVGKGIITEFHAGVTNTQNLSELAILLVASLTLLILIDKLPAMVSGIITGAGIGSMGVGSFGAGAATGAAIAAGSGISSMASTAGSVASKIQKAASDAGQAMKQGAGAFGGINRVPGDSLNLSKAMGTATAFATEMGKSMINQGKNK